MSNLNELELMVGDVYFTIDLDKLEKITISNKNSDEDKFATTTTTTEYDGNGRILKTTVTATKTNDIQYNTIKYSLAIEFLNIVLDYSDPNQDTQLNFERIFSDAPIGFKVAFNTLIKLGILVAN